MRNRIGSILWGLAFVIAGVGFAGNAFGVWDFNLFFDGWWTLFIIVPAVISMIQSGPHTGNIICALIGVVLLLGAQDILDRHLMGKLFLPVLLVVIGISILLGGRRRVATGTAQAGMGGADAAGYTAAQSDRGGVPNYSGVFSGCDVRWPAEPFHGANITAVFGGVDLDLRDAVFEGDVVVNATTIFGGADLKVPPHVRVKVTGTPVFGGVDNRADGPASEGTPVLYLNASCVFGGIDIK